MPDRTQPLQAVGGVGLVGQGVLVRRFRVLPPFLYNARFVALLVLAIAALAVVATVSWDMMEVLGGLEIPILLALVLAAMALLPWMLGFLRGGIDLFEPTIVVSAVAVLGYVLPAFGILGGWDAGWLRWGEGRISSPLPGLLSRALLLSCMGLAAFFIGYYGTGILGRKGSVKRLALDPRRLRTVAAAFAVLASLSLVAFLVMVGGPASFVARLNDRVRLFSGLNWFLFPVTGVLAVALVYFARDWAADRSVRWRVWTVGGIALAMNLAHASKTNLLAAALAFLVVRHYLVRRTNPLAALAIGGLAAFVAVVFDLFFREFLILRAVSSIDLSLSPLGVLRLGWTAFSANTFLQLPSLMLLIEGIPERLSFQWGRPYLTLILMAVPRSIFPGKPPGGTETFSRAFFPDYLDEGTSIPTSLLGDFYMNFGVVGIMLGALAAGFIARKMYSLAERATQWPGGVPLYATFLVTIFPWLRGDTFGPTVFFLSFAAPVFILTRLAAVPAASGIPARVAPAVRPAPTGTARGSR